MADKRVKISRIALKGPAGNITTDKRVKITRIALHGSQDKRVKITRIALDHVPFDKRVKITRIALVGPSSVAPPVYRDTPTGWQPVVVYMPNGTNWEAIT